MQWMYLYFYVQVCEGFFIFVFISVTAFYSKHKASFSGWILDPVKEDPRYHSNLRRSRSWTLVWPVHQMENRASVRRGKFQQQTGSKWGRNNRFRDMGFFQKIPVYQTSEEFAEKSERFGRFSRCSEHVFSRCGQLKSGAEFLLGIHLFEQQISVCRGGVGSL